MSVAEESELSRDEVDDFLGSQETGVLSLAKGDDPYAIPVSYGYSTGDRRFYFRLVSTPESEKRRYLGSSPHGRVVVYDEGDGEYTSAVAEGVLEEIRRDELDVHHVEQYGDAKR
ncbi:MAG: pyridoxamine 5'-phosphate oxidase family protein, partial [Halobacteriota archaeon]